MRIVPGNEKPDITEKPGITKASSGRGSEEFLCRNIITG
jgi:hypothetical protein